MYLKEFEIRWSDVDANRHLANAAYTNFMSHARMSFLTDNGFTHKQLATYNIGPIVFYEHMYYFKEVFAGKPVRVSVEIAGMSEDLMFFEFHHNFYDSNGKNFAHCEMMGAWMDLGTRKLIPLPEELQPLLGTMYRSENYRTLTKEDTRKYGKLPMDI